MCQELIGKQWALLYDELCVVGEIVLCRMSLCYYISRWEASLSAVRLVLEGSLLLERKEQDEIGMIIL